MAYINKRVFGGDISSPIKKTLHARQTQQNKSELNIGDPIANITETYGTNLDFSERIPWARMWTVIRGYDVVDCSEGTNVSSNTSCKEQIEKLKKLSNKSIKKDGKGLFGKTYDNSTIQIYEIGNHQYDEYVTTNTFESTDVENDNYFMPEGMLTANDYYKPNAGIIDIQSTTQGNLGIYVETVVNFKVYNYFDYSNIFTKFFLYPGAQVFIDFGWNTSHIYDQKDYFNNDSDDYNLWRERIYGMSDDDDENSFAGLIEESGGELESLSGYVTDYNAVSAPDGSFNCSLTVVSRNNALLTYDQKGRGQVKEKLNLSISKKIMTKLGNYIIKHKLAEEDDPNLISKINFINQLDGLSKFSLDFYHILLSRLHRRDDEGNLIFDKVTYSEYEAFSTDQVTKSEEKFIEYNLISEDAIKAGIWYPLTDSDTHEFTPIEGKGKYSKFSEMSNKIYVSMRFLEDDILNPMLSIKTSGYEDSYSEQNVRFDSTYQYATFDPDLYMFQITTQKFANAGGSPGVWYQPQPFVDDNMHNIKAVNVRDLWIRLDLIEDAFESSVDVLDSMEKLLISMSQETFNVINFQLTGAGGERVSIIDYNSPIINNEDGPINKLYDGIQFIPTDEWMENPSDYGADENEERYHQWYEWFNAQGGTYPYLSYIDLDKDWMLPAGKKFKKKLKKARQEPYDFDNLFTFTPYAQNSMVKSMNLSLAMPSNTMSTALSINATSVDKHLFPTSREVLSFLALKDLHIKGKLEENEDGEAECNGDLTKVRGYEWLPQLSPEMSNRVNEISLHDRLTNISKAIDDNIVPKKTITDYGWFFGLGPNTEEYLNDYDEVFANIIGEVTMTKTKLDESLSEQNVIDDQGNQYKLASSIPEYFKLKIESTVVPDSTDNQSIVLLPYTISLTLYGIAQFLPGSVFKVDWVPEIYRDRVVFITEKVTNKLSSGIWETQIDGMMMMRSDKIFKCGFKPLNIKPNWNPKMLNAVGYDKDQIEEFIKNPNTAWWDVKPKRVIREQLAVELKEAEKNFKVRTKVGLNEYDDGSGNEY